MVKRDVSVPPVCKGSHGKMFSGAGKDRTLFLEDLSGLRVEDGSRGALWKQGDPSGGLLQLPGCELPVGWVEKGAEAMQGGVWIPGWLKGGLDRSCWGWGVGPGREDWGGARVGRMWCHIRGGGGAGKVKGGKGLRKTPGSWHGPLGSSGVEGSKRRRAAPGGGHPCGSDGAVTQPGSSPSSTPCRLGNPGEDTFPHGASGSFLKMEIVIESASRGCCESQTSPSRYSE